MSKSPTFQKWRLIGLLPITFWIYTLVIYLTIAKNAMGGPQNAPYAWQYVLWACPMACLIIGIGILIKNRFLTGVGALWGIAPVFLMDILIVTSNQVALANEQGFSIPFIRLTEEFSLYLTQWIDQSAITQYLISEFTIHWLGDFIFGLIALVLVGLTRWSFTGTAFLYLSTVFFTNYICPFGPPNPPGAPSMLIQSIPLIVIWAVLDQSIYGLKYNKRISDKILFGILTLYFCAAITLFQWLETINRNIPILLLLAYLILLAVGKIIINRKTVFKSLKEYNKKKNRPLTYISYAYGALFLIVYFFMLRPTLIKEGNNPVSALILFGLIPFTIIFTIGFYLTPRFRKKNKK
jgi:hypothetical protein